MDKEIIIGYTAALALGLAWINADAIPRPVDLEHVVIMTARVGSVLCVQQGDLYCSPFDKKAFIERSRICVFHHTPVQMTLDCDVVVE